MRWWVQPDGCNMCCRQDLKQHLLLHWLRLKGAGKHKAPQRVQQTSFLHRAQAGACIALCPAVLQVGLAEAGVAMAKLAARQGDEAGAASHVAAALGHYSE